jgi:L-fuculose-phosphate aldolase
VIPYVKDTDTIILANHGTITCGSDLEDAYFKTEIIDAYCRILILTKQIGRTQYYSDEKAAELINLKPKLGIRDARLERGLENCDLCGNSMFREGYSDFAPESQAFVHPKLQGQGAKPAAAPKAPAPRKAEAAGSDGVEIESLVKLITDQVMQAMNGSTDDLGNHSVVKKDAYASGISGGV